MGSGCWARYGDPSAVQTHAEPQDLSSLLSHVSVRVCVAPYVCNRVWEVELSTAQERDLERRRSDQKEARVKRIKDIVWTAVIASVITIIVVTSLGWLTTQSVVEKAREEGAKELVSLRASICLVRFQQSPDAQAKLAEFKALSWGDRDAAIRKLVTEAGFATMLGEAAPAPGAIDKCADAIKGSIP
jgi:hypothetical protein